MKSLKEIRAVIYDLLHDSSKDAYEILSDMKADGEIVAFGIDYTTQKSSEVHSIEVFLDDCAVRVTRNE